MQVVLILNHTLKIRATAMIIMYTLVITNVESGRDDVERGVALAGRELSTVLNCE